MNADKHKWFACCWLLSALTTSSISSAGDVAFQLTNPSPEQQSQDDNRLDIAPWTFTLLQDWEAEQKKVMGGWDGFIIAKKPRFYIAYLLAFAPGMKTRNSVHIHPYSFVDDHI